VSKLSRDRVKLWHHLRVRRRTGDSRKAFFARTIAAQIHAVAAVGFVIAVALVLRAGDERSFGSTLAVVVFGATATLLFAASSGMHFLSEGYRVSQRLERALEDVDKVAIYLLIAGTYTAIGAHALPPETVKTLLKAIWSIGVLGCFYTLVLRDRLPRALASRWVETGLFLAMGWTILPFIRETYAAMTAEQLVWFGLGGGFYTLGAIGYGTQWPNPTKRFGYHEIWHSMVVLGNASFVVLVAKLM